MLKKTKIIKEYSIQHFFIIFAIKKVLCKNYSQLFTKGEHSFQIHLTEKGIYAVELRVNGIIYRKKISIS